MAGGCAPTSTLENSTFVNVCIVGNATSNTPIQSALQTCCGSDNVFTSGCYNYCNITSTDDGTNWGLCMVNNLEPQAFVEMDSICGAAKSDPNTTVTLAGKIATTYTAPDISLTYTESVSGIAVTTLVVNPASIFKETEAVTTTAPYGNGTETTVAGPTATSTPGNLTVDSSTPGYSVLVSSTSFVANPTSVSSSPSPTISPSKAASGLRVSKFGVAVLLGLVSLGSFAW